MSEEGVRMMMGAASESESVWEWSEGAICVGCRPFVCGEEVTTCGTHGGDVTMG